MFVPTQYNKTLHTAVCVVLSVHRSWHANTDFTRKVKNSLRFYTFLFQRNSICPFINHFRHVIFFSDHFQTCTLCFLEFNYFNVFFSFFCLFWNINFLVLNKKKVVFVARSRKCMRIPFQLIQLQGRILGLKHFDTNSWFYYRGDSFSQIRKK